MMPPRATGGGEVERTAGGGPDRRRLWRELGVELAVLGLTLAVLAGLAVLPARTWWAQRQSINEARDQLARAEAEVSELRAQRDLLATDAEVERLARRDFDLVYPGEESYRIVPADGG